MLRKLRWFLLLSLSLLLLCLFLPGCSKEKNAIIASSSKLWNVQINVAEVVSQLEGSQTILQYSGSEVTLPLEQTPKEGYVFLLLDMVIEKQEVGKGTFSWENTYVLDANGNKYTRHSNDTFLEQFGLKRLKGSNINFGTNEGYVCYEIPKSVINNNLWFVYEDSENGDIKIGINIK